ncbi:MAG: SAM-dependent chlorinase/fluorinase [Flavobacteriales bacterium]|nr:SAM-dependent chlorinase/fluorinase [Flavobacteriales bacterium]
MPIVTLTTDFGAQSHFVAQLKGNLCKILPDCNIIDISHSITSFDLNETAFLLKNTIFHFPPNSIHAIGVDSSLDVYKGMVIAKKEDQFIIAANNGIIPMIFDNEPYEYVYIEHEIDDYFSFKNIFPQYIKKIQENKFSIHLPEALYCDILIRQIQKPVFIDNNITFNIMYTDAFGNAYTNLKRSFFENIVGDKLYKICLSKFEYVDKISTTYSDVNEGSMLCFFDENDYMVIAINKDRADLLLGLSKNSKQLVVEILEGVK